MSRKYPMPTDELIKMGNTMLPAFKTVDGELVLASSHRQDRIGPKCHGGHCAMCGCELPIHTNESARGVCDECAEKDDLGRWD